MRTIELNPLSFIASPDEKKFILLRSKQADKDESFLNDFAVPKILKKDNANKIPGVWGTLGYSDDRPINWTGILECSNEGNDDFVENSTVKDEIDLLKYMYPNLMEKGEIREKVINLNQLEIPLPSVFSLNEIPKLRLNIFLDQEEGALAFYQFKQENDKDSELEFILPEATDEENSTTKRDRLTYLFNVIPNKKIEEVPDIPNMYRLSSKFNEDDFIVKVLIFKRLIDTKKNKNKLPSSSSELVDLIEEKLASYPDGLLVKKHALLIFNDRNNTFTEAQPGSIDTSKKTLLLLHGTFASTKGSFKEVYDWIGTLVGDNKYEQVIAFDHPTFFYDAEMNINVFFKKLETVGVQNFTQDIDLIGTSQGGLVAQYLANLNQTVLKVGKVALVASANGVDYLTFAQGLTNGLKLFRKVMLKMGLAPAAMISALFQHSFKWIIKQPGMELMKPGNPKLESIIYQKPHLSTTKYLPVAGNYHATGLKKRIELAIDAILDEENDWMVGTKNQFKAPGDYVAIDNYNPGKYREFMINDAIHGSLIEKEEAKNRIEQFFFHDNIGLIDVNHANSEDYFDAHCHLFGRNVITGRLILMLLGDLIDYFKQDNPNILLPPIELRSNDDEGNKLSEVIRNIFKYFLFNKGAHQMLHDLEDDYYEVKSGTFRYIPLMFDIEMTFRNNYDENNAIEKITEKMDEFKEEHEKFIDKIEKVIDRAKKGKKVFKGTQIQNDESLKLLEYASTIIKGLKLAEENVFNDAKDSYFTQLEEMRQLKTIYGADIFPFLATDPRRSNMDVHILKHVIEEKTFHGIKIYTPNGYSPTDPHLFDPDLHFIDGTCLYQWCIDNKKAIMAHNSDAGFATFTDKLQVFGDICTDEPDDDCTFKLEYKDKEYIEFDYNLKNGGFDKAVKERAHRLNHPCIWRKVLTRFPDLKICFAHFGGGNEDWQNEIVKLILDFDHVFTDLSCQTNKEKLQLIHTKFFETDSPENLKIRSRIMYGSDYFLNMLQGIKFENYYMNFKSVFSDSQLENMQLTVPKDFLT